MLKWLSNLFSRQEKQASAAKLYQSVMKYALAPELYEVGIADDSFEGRFESVTLHSAIIMRNLRQHGQKGRELCDALYRQIFAGFDHALRERGAGDSSIARKIRGYGERFFGLARSVDRAFEAEVPKSHLNDIITRNNIITSNADHLADYLIEMNTKIAGMSFQSIESGEIFKPG